MQEQDMRTWKKQGPQTPVIFNLLVNFTVILLKLVVRSK